MCDIDVLQLLELAYGGSKEARTEATQRLEDSLRMYPKELVVALLRAGCDVSLAPDRSLSALLYVKNFIVRDMTGETFRGTPELDMMKQILLSGVATVSEKHRRVLLVVVETIISEFGWNYFPEVMPSVIQFEVTGADKTPLAQALLDAVYVLTKRFKTATLEPMQMKLEVCRSLCEHLPKFFALNDMHVFHKAFKIFECATETFQQLPQKQLADLPIPRPLLDSWLSYMGQFPQTFHQAAVQLGGEGYRIYVKCVKRLGSICFSILHDATKKKKAAAIAVYFLERYSQPFVQMWIQWLTFCLESKDRSTHRKSEIFAIRFIKMATLDENLFRKEIQPNALNILEKQLFPFLCFIESDEEVFADETALQEYSQYMLDENVITGEYSQRQAASNAILAMVGGKKDFHDKSLLPGILQIIHTGLSSMESNEEAAHRTFGFLHLLCILRKHIREEQPQIWATQLESVLCQYVAPRISSPFVFIKCKAIYVCQRYSKIPWADANNFSGFISAMCGLVCDRDARVRLSTIDAMCTLLEMKRARQYLIPVLVPLVNECIALLERVQTTFVPLVLNYLAEHYAAELTPVLDKLVHSLVQQFLAATFDMQSHEANYTEDVDLKGYETLGLSAFQSMSAINNIVLSTEYNRAALTPMIPDLTRMLKAVFEQADSFDFMDKAIEIFQHVVFMTKPVPAACWELFPVVYHCVMNSGSGVDYFAKFEGVLDNFVSNSPEEYLGNSQVMTMTYAMCEKMLVGGVVANDEDIVAAPQLIEALMHQGKHCSNPLLFTPYLPQYVTLLLRALSNGEVQARGVHVRMWLIVAMMDAFYFDAATTLNTIVESGAYPHFFNGYFDFFSGIVQPQAASGKKKSKKNSAAQEVIDSLTILFRKVNILGLTSFLLAVTDPSGPYLSTMDPNFIAAAVRMVNYCIESNAKVYVPRCKKLEEIIPKVLEGYEEEKEEDFDEEDMDLGEGDDEDDEGDLTNAPNTAGDDDDEDVEEADEDLQPDDTDDYMSPIDNVCEVGFYLQWLQAARSVSSPCLTQSQAGMISDASLVEAEAVSKRFLELLNQLERAREADHVRRANTAMAATVVAA